MTGCRVGHIDECCVRIGEEQVDCYTVFWAAGVIASPAAKWLDAEHDRAGRVKVEPDLSIAGHPNVFAIGDTALSEAWDGQPVPGLAPAAKQAGAHAAEVIRARLEGQPAPKPFRYRHAGSLATIGRRSAVADFGLASPERIPRLVVLGRCACPVSLGHAQPRLGDGGMVLGLSHLPPQHPPDHRRGQLVV